MSRQSTYNAVLIIAFFLTSAVILSGCHVGKEYTRPEVVTDTSFIFSHNNDSANIALIKWDSIFTDTVLKALIDSGLKNNLDLRIAVERIKESQSLLSQKGAEFEPTLGLELRGSVSRISPNSNEGGQETKPQYNYRGGFTASWEADIWGKLSSAERGAYADLLRTEAAKRTIQTKLIADIANEYYNLLLYRTQEKIITETIRNREEDLLTVMILKNSALLTEADVKQSEANVYSAKLLLPRLYKNINISENVINRLLGRTPRKLVYGDLDDSPQQMIDTSAGYPSQLLLNRPDIAESEQALVYAFENTNVARANFYPTFRITASAGLEAFSIGDFFSFPGSIFATAIGDIFQPIFNKRKNKTELEVALARQRASAYSFRGSFIRAVQEVSDALFNYKISGEIINLYSMQTEALDLALEYSRELLVSGYANYIDVLRAEDQYLSSRLEYSRARADRLQAGVELYRSLGGGWR